MTDPGTDGAGDASQKSVPTADEPEPGATEGATVGTGSSLAVGCIAAIIVLVLVAIALRSLTGVW